MTKFVRALLCALACFAVCALPAVAFAADAATDVLAIPSDHPALAGMALLTATMVKLLQSDVPWFPTWLRTWRLALVLFLSMVSGAIDMATKGTGIGAAVVAAMATGLPALVVEIFHAIGNGGGSGGPPDVSKDAHTIPPPPPQPSPYSGPKPAALVGLGLAVLALGGCPKGGSAFHWPDAAACAPGITSAIGEVSQVLVTDNGDGKLSDAGKAKLEQLGIKYGGETVLCLVDTLIKTWTSPGAAMPQERINAAVRAQAFLASTGARIERK